MIYSRHQATTLANFEFSNTLLALENTRVLYERDLLTGLGLLEKLNIPRDRLGEFTPELLNKWQRATKPMDDLVLSLYARGMTTRDINDVVEKIYGKSYSPQQVTLITKEIEEERLA